MVGFGCLATAEEQALPNLRAEIRVPDTRGRALASDRGSSTAEEQALPNRAEIRVPDSAIAGVTRAAVAIVPAAGVISRTRGDHAGPNPRY